MSLKEISESVNDGVTNELKDTANDIHSALSTIEVTRKAKLPEKIFKEHFLPYLSGERKDVGVVLAKWTEFAGGGYSEVDVIDNDGEVMFTTPGLLARSSDNSNTNNIKFGEVATTYNLKEARLPAEANRYMNKVADGVKSGMTLDTSSRDDRWNDIFGKYYGGEDNKEAADTATKSTSNVDDMIDYD